MRASDRQYPTDDEKRQLVRFAQGLCDRFGHAALWGPDLDSGYVEVVRPNGDGSYTPVFRVGLRDILAGRVTVENAGCHHAGDCVPTAGD